MSFYTRAAATALKLLTKYGTDTILTHKPTTGGINPVTGLDTRGSSTTTTVKGIYKRIPSDLIDGTRIQTTDKMIVLDNTKEPLMTDTIGSWNIEEITEVKPTITTIIYFVRLRK